jgi:hypothetical protein
MTTIAANLVCINESLAKIHHLIQENPYEAQCLLNEQPEMVSRIQEIVTLLREFEETSRAEIEQVGASY